jgi:hypothetical protein
MSVSNRVLKKRFRHTVSSHGSGGTSHTRRGDKVARANPIKACVERIERIIADFSLARFAPDTKMSTEGDFFIILLEAIHAPNQGFGPDITMYK